MAGLERCAHHLDIASSVEGEVQASVCDLDEVILDALTLWQCRRVDEIRGTHLPCPAFFVGVGIYGNDARCANGGRRGDDAEPDGTAAKDGNA